MLKTLLYISIIAILLLGYIRYLENRNIFFPSKRIEVTPEILHIPFEDVYLKTEDDVKINGWFIPRQEAKYTILFCHGNGGNISHRLEKIVLLREANVGIFIIDYRGYGNSQGKPTEDGLYLDAKAAYDYLVNERNIKRENIILYGESLGGAVAIDLASKVNIGGLISEGAFSNMKDIAKHIYPFLPSFVFSNKFDSVTKVKNVKVPKLFIHSKDDDIIPFKLAQRLFKAAPEPKELGEIKGSHNNSFQASQEAYLSYIKTFLKDLIKSKISGK